MSTKTKRYLVVSGVKVLLYIPLAAAFWWLWNWTIVSMGGPAIDGWQAYGLLWLVGLVRAIGTLNEISERKL